MLSRGSQYRVESMMLRIARKLNYVALSATQKQKLHMCAPECLPLTMEPESAFYATQPIAVLDFQSLYPSVIIAYNICFTTCLGRIDSIGKEGSFRFGCGSLFLPDELLKTLDIHTDLFIAPNGVAFVKPHIRRGILPILLDDILRTRVMVKSSMKLHKSDENLLKIFDSRQLSLKLIANVTFGYTAANFVCSYTIYYGKNVVSHNLIDFSISHQQNQHWCCDKKCLSKMLKLGFDDHILLKHQGALGETLRYNHLAQYKRCI